MNKVDTPTDSNLLITSTTPFAANSTWTLWYHSSEEKKWTPSTYKQIHTVKNWGEFWGLIDTLGEESLLGGFFFLMKNDIPPLWENKANIRGGSYTVRVPRREASDIFLKYSIACIINEAMTNPDNNIIGISIAPKKAYNVISLWNDDFSRFNSQNDLVILTKGVRYDEIRYTKHIDKKF